MVLVHNN